MSAGEALPAATRTLRREATGIELIDGIGATGHALPGYTATVLDESGRRCAPGQIGRLAVKGPTGCRYLDDVRQANYVRDRKSVV